MRNIKALIVTVLLVGVASAVVAAPRSSSGLKTNNPKDDPAPVCYYDDIVHQLICN